jgi:hypothetical protein
MRLVLLALICILASASLSGCAPPKTAWSHYDECATQNLPFADMVACGKAHRTAYCEEHHDCSADGNAVVMYADSLVQSVNRHELSEAEAQRKWIEFRTARVDVQRQLAMQAAAATAGPTTCVRSGAVTNCF